MEIEDCGEIKSFEPMPTEQTLFFSAITNNSVDWWGGPAGKNKAEVIGYIQNYDGVVKARIYSVKLPVDAKPA